MNERHLRLVEPYKSPAARKMELRVEALKLKLWQALIQESVTLEGAITKTSSSHGILSRLVLSGKAVSFTEQETGITMLPTWQLRQNAISPVIPEAAELARVFPQDLAVLNFWVSKPNINLEDQTPVEFLQQGRGEEVVALVSYFGAMGR